MYLIFRACERVNPVRIFGKAFMELPRREQLRILGYAELRAEEEDPRQKD